MEDSQIYCLWSQESHHHLFFIPLSKTLLSIKFGKAWINFSNFDFLRFFLANCFTCGWYFFANYAASIDVSLVSMSLYSSPVVRMKGVPDISSTSGTCESSWEFTREKMKIIMNRIILVSILSSDIKNLRPTDMYTVPDLTHKPFQMQFFKNLDTSIYSIW